ncbi:MAG: hypothetical protein HY699_24915 [Deltaproteobacteria bacterium]|nr:hypothetical protein [Deltaproteobacteria bacterium]
MGGGWRLEAGGWRPGEESAVSSGSGFGAFITELSRYLRVVTEADGETVHNAFLDRGFKP